MQQIIVKVVVIALLLVNGFNCIPTNPSEGNTPPPDTTPVVHVDTSKFTGTWVWSSDSIGGIAGDECWCDSAILQGVTNDTMVYEYVYDKRYPENGQYWIKEWGEQHYGQYYEYSSDSIYYYPLLMNHEQYVPIVVWYRMNADTLFIKNVNKFVDGSVYTEYLHYMKVR